MQETHVMGSRHEGQNRPSDFPNVIFPVGPEDHVASFPRLEKSHPPLSPFNYANIPSETVSLAPKTSPLIGKVDSRLLEFQPCRLLPSPNDPSSSEKTLLISSVFLFPSKLRDSSLAQHSMAIDQVTSALV